MNCSQRGYHLRNHWSKFLPGKTSAMPSYIGSQILSLQKLHHIVCGIIFIKQMLYNDHIGMGTVFVQQLRLPKKPVSKFFEGLRLTNRIHPLSAAFSESQIARHILFDRHPTLFLHIPGHVGHAESAPPQVFSDQVPLMKQVSDRQRSRRIFHDGLSAAACGTTSHGDISVHAVHTHFIRPYHFGFPSTSEPPGKYSVYLPDRFWNRVSVYNFPVHSVSDFPQKFRYWNPDP